MVKQMVNKQTTDTRSCHFLVASYNLQTDISKPIYSADVREDISTLMTDLTDQKRLPVRHKNYTVIY